MSCRCDERSWGWLNHFSALPCCSCQNCVQLGLQTPEVPERSILVLVVSVLYQGEGDDCGVLPCLQLLNIPPCLLGVKNHEGSSDLDGLCTRAIQPQELRVSRESMGITVNITIPTSLPLRLVVGAPACHTQSFAVK